MKTIAWGATALNLILIVAGVLALGLVLWLLVPAALPVSFTFGNGVATAGLLLLARGVFK